MCIRINVANYSQFNAKTMFTTVYKSVLQTNSHLAVLLTNRSLEVLEQY